MIRSDIQCITLNSSLYPALVRHIPDPPAQLYVRGNTALLNSKYAVAVVGSRKATTYGQEAIDMLLPDVIAIGTTIVSGLALGIDGMAHRAALAAHAPTIAVLAGGIDDTTIYPKQHLSLAHDIIANDGLLVSEHAPGTAPLPAAFLHRNRIIAGLSQATVVIQAAQRSGSLVTARLALEYNREVLAVPGAITDSTSTGTNILIHQGATPALTSQDIIDALGITVLPAQQTLNLGEELQIDKRIV